MGDIGYEWAVRDERRGVNGGDEFSLVARRFPEAPSRGTPLVPR